MQTVEPKFVGVLQFYRHASRRSFCNFWCLLSLLNASRCLPGIAEARCMCWHSQNISFASCAFSWLADLSSNCDQGRIEIDLMTIYQQ